MTPYCLPGTLRLLYSINSFNPPNNHMRWKAILSSWSIERLSNLLKDTELVSARCGFKLNQWLRSLCFWFNLFNPQLCWVYCMRAVSSFGEWGLLARCCAQASHRSGFSCCRAQLQTHGLQWWQLPDSSTGSVVVAHRFSCSKASGIFLDQESNLCSLHCSGFLTSGPPGKSLSLCFKHSAKWYMIWGNFRRFQREKK